jgi:hypothetical protein
MNTNQFMIEWVTHEQEKRLRSLDDSSDESKEDRWIEIYHIVFPDVDSTDIPGSCEIRPSDSQFC